MGEQLALEAKRETAIQPASTMNIIQMAVSQGASIETIERLVALKEREDAAQAKRAFDQALSEFKAHAPLVTKNREVAFGNTKYKHATLDHVASVLLDSLSKCGLTYTWEQKQDGSAITVTCILSHIQGHKITNSLTASPDTSGSKNPIQAIASAVSYLRRYTVLGVLGMAESGEDDDAQSAAPGPKMPDETLQEWIDAMRQAETKAQLQTLYTDGFKAARTIGDQNAMKRIAAVKEERKAALHV